MGTKESALQLDGVTPLQQMVSTCAGALLTSLIVTPLDVVKIRLQAQRNPFYKGKCFVYCNGLMDHLCICEDGNKAWYKASGHFKGTLDAFSSIVRNEGVTSLWSGLPPTLVMAVPATIIYFTCYDLLRNFLTWKMGGNADFAPLFAGALARVVSVTLVSPLELIRTRMQYRQLTYRELGDCINSAVAKDGWRSLWKGWGPTVLRDVPFSAMYWYNYEQIKKWLCKTYSTSEPTFLISFTAGALSGSIAAVATLPFDVVKTNRQIALGQMDASNVIPKQPSSTWKVMKKIFAENGFTGLYAGFLPRVIKVAPACAIMISTYEFGKSFFRKRNKEQQKFSEPVP
ncbi:solute carrier family 25 member 40 [Protopterus annectens]|uniref:solute carrier family 25 member 40 n=1 Tax=Protopterus annectens TaxID=7888 RepID=UPI001CF9A6FD|nr:solute carrier family 25 member 40 [Protopterus annectens]